MEKKDIVKDQVISCFNVLTSIVKENLFFTERKDMPRGFLMVCSDEGFLGEVNTIIADAALSRALKEKAKFIVLGERGGRILKDSGVDFILFPSVKNDIGWDHIKEIADCIMGLYKKGEIGSLFAIYMKFMSFTSHHLDVIKLLPCDELAGYIKGKEADALKTLVEPDIPSVVEYLVKIWLENNLYNIFWSSKLSEWAIRVMHLEHSSDELKEVNKNLRFKYFKAVHALSDKVIREIFAAKATA